MNEYGETVTGANLMTAKAREAASMIRPPVCECFIKARAAAGTPEAGYMEATPNSSKPHPSLWQTRGGPYMAVGQN